MSRLSNSWELVKASWRVLKADKELIIFPIVSTIGTIIVTVLFAIPMAFAGIFDHITNDQIGIGEMIVGFAFYLIMYFVVIFSNTALVGAALIRLRGGDPTLRDGFNIAVDHLPQILGYAAISATVGVILRAIQERGGIVGKIAGGLLGMAWNVITYLVVPILVVENVGPVEAVKRSTGYLKRTWGEQLIGNFSIGLVFGLLTVAAVLVIGVPVMIIAAATGSAVLIGLGVLLIVLLVAGISLISSTLNGIYVAALYQYASEGATSSYFSPDMIQGAFRQK